MNIFDIFKQFKTIKPDPQFSEKSKRIILASPQNAPSKTGSIFVFLHAIETGAAFVLVGFFVLLMTGAFSGVKYLAPVQYSVIDPAGLHAEADAIDMQIQLANVTYLEVTSTAESTTPSASSPEVALRSIIANTTGGSATTTTSTLLTDDEGSSTSSSSISIDEALQKLSQ
jgi:hypothetical protein